MHARARDSRQSGRMNVHFEVTGGCVGRASILNREKLGSVNALCDTGLGNAGTNLVRE